MTDGKVLTCRLCHTNVSHFKKSQITQHLETKKHTSAAERANSSTTNNNNNNNTSNNNNQLSYIADTIPPNQHNFNHDLITTLHGFNTPPNKLDQRPFIDFIHKYTGYHLPSR